MEDLKLLQRRWEEAYEAMPKLYENTRWVNNKFHPK